MKIWIEFPASALSESGSKDIISANFRHSYSIFSSKDKLKLIKHLPL